MWNSDHAGSDRDVEVRRGRRMFRGFWARNALPVQTIGYWDKGDRSDVRCLGQ